MNVVTEMEFSVEMSCQSCADSVQNALADQSVKVLSIDPSKNHLLVQTNRPWQEVQDLIESCGKRAALMGLGSGGVGKNLGAAVVEIASNAVKGVVRIVQLDKDTCLFDGTIHGLSPGEHGISVNEFGDLSRGCESCGNHFNPYNQPHGGRKDQNRHLGDLGNVIAQSDGRAFFKFTDDQLKVWDMIGRSFVIHQNADDLGRGRDQQSKIDGNTGPGIACAIIARSAGLFQNPKRFCTCDGVSVFDERNVPVVGRERTKQKL